MAVAPFTVVVLLLLKFTGSMRDHNTGSPQVLLQPESGQRFALLSQALEHFNTYMSTTTSVKDISITYVVITGAATVDWAELMFLTWGKAIKKPHRLLFVADSWMRPGSKDYNYSFLNLPNSMIPIHYSNSETAAKEHRVGGMTEYDRSQLKWLDAIIYLGEELEIASSSGRSIKNITDWYVFLDDDTLMIPSGIKALLSEYDPKQSLLIGKGGKECHKLCGGAGFALSVAMMNNLYARSTELVEAFFTEYVSGHGLFDSDATKHQSDVVLSNYILQHDNLGRFIRRQEFRGFDPTAAARWVVKQHGSNAKAGTVSFHKLGSAAAYRQVFQYFT